MSEFVVLTTAARDAKIQKAVRKISAESVASGSFKINIEFWEDIKTQLSNKANLPLMHAFFSDLVVDQRVRGMSVGRVIRLNVGVGQVPDTKYDLLIGYVPRLENHQCWRSIRLMQAQKKTKAEYRLFC